MKSTTSKAFLGSHDSHPPGCAMWEEFVFTDGASSMAGRQVSLFVGQGCRFFRSVLQLNHSVGGFVMWFIYLQFVLLKVVGRGGVPGIY